MDLAQRKVHWVDRLDPSEGISFVLEAAKQKLHVAHLAQLDIRCKAHTYLKWQNTAIPEFQLLSA